MMTSHGKLRKEKGSLAEYESQMKGKSLCICVLVCAMCLSLCASVHFYHTSVCECALTCMPEFI